MSLERRLREALHEVDHFEPNPDLFARVSSSVEEDIAHRRRVRRVSMAAAFTALGIAGYVSAVVGRSGTGQLVAPRWSIELLTTAVMVVLTLVLGPAIRRFGRIFVADAFRLDPGTGDRFLRLLDIAYYLAFSGMILLEVTLTDLETALSLRLQLAAATERLALFLLVMGLLHATTLVVLPVIGLVFSSTVRRVRRTAVETASVPSLRAEAAERVVRLLLWALGGLAAAGAVLAAVVVVVIGVGA